MRIKLILVLIVIIATGFILNIFYFKNSQITTSQNTISNAQDKVNLIVLDTPKPNEKVVSPLVIKGRARGYWFFEASFPVVIKDENGNDLGIVPAQADGEWMTEDFVPFQATLIFKKPTTAKGILLLKKDNPSGDPVRDETLFVPITF